MTPTGSVDVQHMVKCNVNVFQTTVADIQTEVGIPDRECM
jgi:hypothetical protein